ncbi:conserved hypothetical protein [Neospora caninum Liverpool]|uniref:Toxoplasma gondii family A protein n=1 Tax=Neospora caninum (strain Liverpool) TaxID=572307 RepID=F0VJZ8_NEOCL|nr:conserved hypothetical protein [Neospora caninum Liverpool]CBZ53228.1 conserved hypothetical protein [Neospora caninum Liverpool]CEL67218.1 TPA: hypothetical protein BN1204_030150 [Neospora caninum Liverpool]|eukprot:XP_003883260.1 conserved hypothetical protein [Neospora caninum Liverpool]
MANPCPLKFRSAGLALWVPLVLFVAVEGLEEGPGTPSAAVTVVLDDQRETRSFREDVWLHGGDALDLIDRTGGAAIYPTTYTSQAFRFINGKCDTSQPINYVEIYLATDKNHIFWTKKSASPDLRKDSGDPRKGIHTPIPTVYRFTSPSSDETAPEFCFIFVVPSASSQVEAISNDPRQTDLGPDRSTAALRRARANESESHLKTALHDHSSLPSSGTTEEQRIHHSITRQTIEKGKEAPQRRLHPDFAFDEDPDENEAEDTVFAIINDEERAYMFRRLQAVQTNKLDFNRHDYVAMLVVHSIADRKEERELGVGHDA